MTRAVSLLFALALASSVARAQPAPAVPDPAAGEGDESPGAEPEAPFPGEGAPAPDHEELETEENVLAGLSGGGGDASAAAAGNGPSGSFGSELRLFGLEATWSGYGDLVLTAVPDAKQMTFDASHFNPILGVRLSDHVAAELELELEHGGSQIKVEYAIVELTPSPYLGFRLGKFLVPIGRFNEIYHPSFRWAQISRPLMFRDVVPGVWSEVGAQVRGAVAKGGTTFEYAAYVVNGLGVKDADREKIDLKSEFVRNLRDNEIDNNLDKAIGFRLGLSVLKGHVGATTIGISGYTGDIDDAGDERLSIVDVDLTTKLGPVTLTGEIAQSKLRGASYERGAYAAMSYLLGRTTLTGRWDYTANRPMQGDRVEFHNAVATAKFAPSPAWSVRGEVVLPVSAPDGVEKQLQLHGMLAFVF